MNAHWTVAVLFLGGCLGEKASKSDEEPTPNVVNDDDTDAGGDSAVEDVDSSIANANPFGALTAPDTIAEITDGFEAINPAKDRDFYEIEVEEGEEYVFFTDSAHYAGGTVTLDTVLRVYDGDENLLASNDDMPYRWWETDSAVWIQAPYTGAIYVEVLEWADWAGGYEGDTGWVAVEAEGGPQYTYQLYGALRTATEFEPNGTVAEADANEGAVYYTPIWSDYALEFIGSFDDQAGMDLWPIEITADDIGLYMMWSIYPESTTAGAKPAFVLYDEQMNVLGETKEPVMEPYGAIVEYVGVARRIPAQGKYYLGVYDDSNSAGGTNYVGTVGWVRWLNDLTEGTEENDALSDAEDVALMESETTPDFYFANVWGDLQTGDDVDIFHVTGADLEGQYFTVRVQGETAGSTLGTNLKVTTSDGTELASATDHPNNGSGDPEIRDLNLLTGDDIYVHVEADGRGVHETANWWMLSIYLDKDKVYSP